MNLQSDRVSIKLPRGDQASFEEMQAYGNTLQTFICTQEQQLEKIGNTQQHNLTVEYLCSLADGYNEQLHVFKETEARRQRDIIHALMHIVESSGQE